MPAIPYRPRVVDAELAALLRSAGAVVIEGPKACGKTATARQVAASEVLFDIELQARELATIDPTLVLAGARPRLLDAWQVVPALWNHVRRAVDDADAPGSFLLTGSAVPPDDITRHTGAGRMARLRMRPMALAESGGSTATISLGALLAGEPPRSPDPGLSIPGLLTHCAVGGWPLHLGLDVPDALRATRDYLEAVRRTDIRRVDGVTRDPAKVGRLLQALARHVATEVSISTLAADAGDADGPLARDTVADYLTALERLGVIEDQPAWAPHLRSRARVRGSVKRHFVDPSLAVAALRATPERLLADPNLAGLLFESLVVRDLRIYAQPLGGQVLHYRDNTGLEIDVIVETPDGRWGAFEVKLGTARIDEAATALTRMVDKIDTSRAGPPAVLGVIVGTGYGYRRPDGVAVIPIGALGP